jgi:hypothetical protein
MKSFPALSGCCVQFNTVQLTANDAGSASGNPRSVDETNLPLPCRRESELVFHQNERTIEWKA